MARAQLFRLGRRLTKPMPFGSAPFWSPFGALAYFENRVAALGRQDRGRRMVRCREGRRGPGLTPNDKTPKIGHSMARLSPPGLISTKSSHLPSGHVTRNHLLPPPDASLR